MDTNRQSFLVSTHGYTCLSAFPHLQPGLYPGMFVIDSMFLLTNHPALNGGCSRCGEPGQALRH